MNLIGRFTEIFEDSKTCITGTKESKFHISEEINCTDDENNVLAHGDNLNFMKYLLKEKEMTGKLKLIYIDPPFFSKATYDAVIRFNPVDGDKIDPIKYLAYEDVWQRDMAEYLKMLTSRLHLMKELLAEDGTLWVHLDWHVVHYVKIFLDEIFGEENFVNEIIWHYKSGGSGKRHFARKHDTILVYSKGKKYYFAPSKEKSYNRGFKPYRFKGVKEYKDELGWYTMVTMKDVWTVDMVGRTSAERTGYATQKPEALLERIILSATEKGDLCADFFCGSGTLASVAEKTGRRWICCDGSPLAISGALKRLYPQKSAVRVLEEEKHEDNTQRAEAEVYLARTEIAGSDKELLDISLQNYEIKQLPETLDEKGRTSLKKIQDKDPLQLIEYWSVDFDYDGKIYRPEVIFSKEKGRIQTSYQKLVKKAEKNIVCIKTVDILGNCSFITY